MSRHLEDFVKNNREDFDKFEPGPVVWHNIQQGLKKTSAKRGVMISMTVLRWSAAAAIVLMLGGGAYYFLTKKTDQSIVTAEKKKTNDLPVVTPHDTIKETPNIQQTIEPPRKDDEQLVKNDDSKNNDSYNEELYHYTRLVELKQNEIKKIKKDEPLLYQQFAGDFNKLDSTFHILKKQLPLNPNREQILEAMIQNLQYQEALLNQQLNIIKKINNTKKQAYENAYKTV
jgi:hypothetical protein